MYKNFIKILVIFSFALGSVSPAQSFAEPVNTVEQIEGCGRIFP